jgi:hypothetical protein
MNTTFFVGLDLGKKRDPAAVAVVERVDRARAFQGSEFHRLCARHVERVPLGTPYPEVVERVRQIVQCAPLRGRCALAVDATGVGEPVVDLLRAARLGCELTAVTITSGEYQHSRGSTVWNVPKRDLIAHVQVLLERDELRIARRMPEAGSLVRELLDMQSTTTSSGRRRLGADGHGQHDDLVIALALACWRARRTQIGLGLTPLPGVVC